MGFWLFVQPSPAADSRLSINVGPMTSVVHQPEHLRIIKMVTADPQPGRIRIRCGTVSKKDVEIRYWVARGIGMLKSIGHFSFLGEPLTLELTGTNLTH
jgi:hypothetical protein